MNISAERTNFNALLGIPNQQLKIPPFQRPYAWEAEQIDDLWDDLIQTLGRGHFMGSMVFDCENTQAPVIIDGQQRLATMLLVLALIRDEYSKYNQRHVGRIQQFMESSYMEGEDRFKLRLGDANWPVFRDFVLLAPGDRARKSWEEARNLSKMDALRNRPLLDNAKRLREKVEAYVRDSRTENERSEKLERIEKAIVTGLEFVVLRVPGVDDAFVLFETLNDRGLALSAGDLLKNHLLGDAARRRDSVEDLGREWDRLLESLSGADVSRFLRHYLLISYPRVLKDEVFKLFRDDVKRQGARSLMSELSLMGHLYGQFVDPSGIQPSAVRDVLEDLATLRAVMCYTALLPARRYLDDERFTEYARLAETLTFRYSTICGKDAKELERVYHESARRLAESEGRELETARRMLIQVMPSSEEFCLSFERQSMGREYVVFYVFKRLEEELDTEKKTRERGPVHIEHVMPQTLNDEWKTLLGSRVEEHQEYVNKWGNLTLLGGRKNIAASNQPYEQKRAIYRTSRFQMTQQLAESSRWDLDAISNRQRSLAEHADRVWTVPAR